jgi:hypothetical protein
VRFTSLFGKTYVWIQVKQAGQWRLHSHPVIAKPEDRQPWGTPEHDVLVDLRESRKL